MAAVESVTAAVLAVLAVSLVMLISNWLVTRHRSFRHFRLTLLFSMFQCELFSLCRIFRVSFIFSMSLLFVRVIGNGVRGLCGDCEKDTGKSSKHFKFVFGMVYNIKFRCFNYCICKMIGILVLLLGAFC